MMNDKAKQALNPMRNDHQLSYLLRLWRMRELDCSDWQASLEVPGTGKRIGFASLEQLFAYLIDLSEEDCIRQRSEDET